MQKPSLSVNSDGGVRICKYFTNPAPVAHVRTGTLCSCCFDAGSKNCTKSSLTKEFLVTKMLYHKGGRKLQTRSSNNPARIKQYQAYATPVPSTSNVMDDTKLFHVSAFSGRYLSSSSSSSSSASQAGLGIEVETYARDTPSSIPWIEGWQAILIFSLQKCTSGRRERSGSDRKASHRATHGCHRGGQIEKSNYDKVN